MSEKKAKTINIILAGVIPALIFVVAFISVGVSSGANTIFTSDLNGQYIYYIAYFKTALFSGKGIFYTFTGLLGTETAALIGYYLLSPLNILALLFPLNKIGTAVYFIIFIKIILAGVFSYLYFGRKRNHDYASLIFSTTYAASGFVYAYFMHIMWLDGIVMLPLVALGLEKLIEENRKLLYIASLAATFVFCYYTGYMTAGFALLYTLFLIFAQKRTFKESRMLFGRFMLSSIVAAFISGASLIPTAFSQLGSRNGGSTAEVPVQSFLHIFARLFTGSFSISEFSDGAPQLYMGMFIVVLLIVYFIPEKGVTNKRRTIAAAALLSTFLLSFRFKQLDVVWHIFSPPNSFTHRYAFIFIFLCLIFAEESFFERIDYCKPWKVYTACGIAVLLCIMVMVAGYDFTDIKFLIFDIFCILCFAFVYRDRKENLFFVGAGVSFIMLAINGSIYTSVFDYDDHSNEGFYENFHPVVEYVTDSDDGLYRMEKTFFNSNNDSMLLDYNGLTHFSSSSKVFIQDFMEKLGYNRSYLWASYGHGGTFAGDSLLGVKYILSFNEEDELKLLYNINDVYVYENENALEFGVWSDNTIKKVEADSESPFENIESIYSGLLGEKVKLFTEIDYKTSMSDKVSIREDQLTVYETIDESKTGYLTYTFEAPDDNEIYFYLNTFYEPEVWVYVNQRELGSYLSTYSQGILPIGKFEKGQKVEVKVVLCHSAAAYSGPIIASIDMEQLKTVTQKLKPGSMHVYRHGNTYMSATLSAPKDGAVFTSVPYSKGWEIRVDGEKTKGFEICNALLGFDVSAGEHEIELRFKTQGLIPGILMSFLGLAMFALMYVIEKKPSKLKWCILKNKA